MATNGQNVFETFKYKDVIIKFEHIGKCYRTTQTEAHGNPEYWGVKNTRRFKELLGGKYAKFDEDKLKNCAVAFRKKPERKGGWKDYKRLHGIQGAKNGNGKGKKNLEKLKADVGALSEEQLKDVLSSLNGTVKNGKTIPQWYLDYLNTDHWKSFVEVVRVFWEHKCIWCYKPARDGHHRTHERLGHEKITDVVLSCRECHMRHHAHLAAIPDNDPRILV